MTDASREVLPDGYVWLANVDELTSYTPNGSKPPSTCSGLEDSPHRQRLQEEFEGESLACGQPLTEGFYYNLNNHTALCRYHGDAELAAFEADWNENEKGEGDEGRIDGEKDPEAYQAFVAKARAELSGALIAMESARLYRARPEELKARTAKNPGAQALIAQSLAEIAPAPAIAPEPAIGNQRYAEFCAKEAEEKAQARIEFEYLEDIEMKPIRFIDKPFFQKDCFHLVVGKKGVGKGTFLTDLAARFTRGELGPRRNVIWITAGEDDKSMDIRPRLVAAGKDASAKVALPKIVPRLPRDVSAISNMVKEVGDVGLIVLDPLQGMMPDQVSSNSDSEVRPCISPLNDLAAETGCVIVGVRHLKKDVSQGVLASVLGSSDWANVPRAVIAVAIDDEDDSISHVQVIAGNRLPRGTASKSFRIMTADAGTGGEGVPKAVFLEGDGKSVSELLATNKVGGSKTRLAGIHMLDMLDRAFDLDEGIDADKLTQDAIAATGASFATVRNAKTALKEARLIRFVPVKDEESGKVRKWQIKRTGIERPPEFQAAPQG